MALRAIRYLVLVALLLFSLIVIGLNAHILTLPNPHSPSKRAIEPVPIELLGGEPIFELPPVDQPIDQPIDQPGEGPSKTSDSNGQKTGKTPLQINWKEASKTYEDLGFGVASLTVITVVTIFFLDCRHNTSCPAIRVEIAFLGVLCAMWFATFILGITRSCGLPTAPYYADSLSCPLAATRGAFAFTAVIWALLLVYTPTLYISARLAYKRGNEEIWGQRVRNADFPGHPVGDGSGDHEALTTSG